MRLLAFVLLIVVLSRAKECPTDFTDNGRGICILNRFDSGSRNDAYKVCASHNSYLFEIPNAYANTDVKTLAGPTRRIWIGLTCTSNSITSCVWDSGKALTDGIFSNFDGGKPNATAGACVYVAENGWWYSDMCTKTVASYGCQYIDNAKVPDCKGDAVLFRGSCYYVPPTPDYRHSDGQVACRDTCGEYASIHSAGENSFIRDLISVNNNASYTYLGLNSHGNNGDYSWDDSSPYDFNKFGYENVNIGQCVAMAIVDGEVVGKGKWISSQCASSDAMKVVCKKELVNSCDVEPTTSVSPTLAPLHCDAPYFYTGTGSLYSPGYPFGSSANLCNYVITEDSPTASILFVELSLDRHSSLSLYSSILDTTPFATLTDTTIENQKFESPTNLLKIVFNTTVDSSTNHFKALYAG